MSEATSQPEAQHNTSDTALPSAEPEVLSTPVLPEQLISNAVGSTNQSSNNSNGANATNPTEPVAAGNGSSGSGSTAAIPPRPHFRIQVRNADGMLVALNGGTFTHTSSGTVTHTQHFVHHPRRNMQQTMSNNNNVTPLPPLEAQPVPHQGHCDESLANNVANNASARASTAASTEDNEGENNSGVPENKFKTSEERKEELEARTKEMKKFECAICFEYMDKPVGCGSCQTRFCHPCLRRVLHHELNNRPPRSTDPPNSGKCPHCRSFFAMENILQDSQLQKEISACTDTVTCPYVGCNKELRIGLLKSHEASCMYVRMRCRYADWGCEWVGKKMELEDHEHHECEFKGGLGNLVEKFRGLDAQHTHALQQQHMQLHATNRMVMFQSRYMLMVRGRNAGNVFDVLQLSYEVTCFPGRFSVCKELWGNMLSQGARSLACSILLLLPSLALILRVSIRGFQILSSLQIDSITGDDAMIYLDMLLLSLLTGLLGILCIACFFIDTKSSDAWTVYNIRDVIRGSPLLRDVAACCMAMAHFSAIEFFGPNPGILMWGSSFVATILGSSFVATMIEKNSNATDVATNARAWPVVLFGLRYGFLSWCCELGPSLVAVIAFRLGKAVSKLPSMRNAPSWITSEESECFVAQLSVGTLTFGLIAIAAFYTSVAVNDSILEIFCNQIIAIFTLGFLNLSIDSLQKLGKKLAAMTFAARTSSHTITSRLDAGHVLPSQRPSPIGVSVFGICSFLMICIVLA